MQEFVVFITNHWILVSLMGVLLLAFLINEFIHQLRGAREISPEQAVQLMNHQEAVVFDIRSESLFFAGHILGAESVSLTSLDKKMGMLQKYHKKPIILVSTVSQDRTKIVATLKAKGFLEVVSLKGGIEGWKTAGLPLVKA